MKREGKRINFFTMLQTISTLKKGLEKPEILVEDYHLNPQKYTELEKKFPNWREMLDNYLLEHPEYIPKLHYLREKGVPI